MLKEFMLKNVIPQLQDRDGRSQYIQDPLRAAVIMLCVYRQHGFRLADAESNQLCNALCLPDLEQGQFLHYWTAFSRDVALLKRWVPESMYSTVSPASNR